MPHSASNALPNHTGLTAPFSLTTSKIAHSKLLCTSKRRFFDRFWRRWAQSYCTYYKNTFAKRYGKDTFEAGLHYFCMAKIRKRSLLGGFVLFSSSIPHNLFFVKRAKEKLRKCVAYNTNPILNGGFYAPIF